MSSCMELPHGSYSISDTQDCFEYILKKRIENNDNPSIKICINKIENYLQLLKLEAMKLLGSNENKISKEKNG